MISLFKNITEYAEYCIKNEPLKALSEYCGEIEPSVAEQIEPL